MKQQVPLNQLLAYSVTRAAQVADLSTGTPLRFRVRLALGKFLQSCLIWLLWRSRHHVLYRCVHPKNCRHCSWCGFGFPK